MGLFFFISKSNKKLTFQNWFLLFLFFNSTLLFPFSKDYNLDSLILEYSTKPKFGLFAAYGLNHHFGSFKSLPTIPCCSPGFSYASGWGWFVGAIADYFIDSVYSINVRASYWQNDAYFSKKEETNIIIDGVSQLGLFEHQLNSWFNYISLEICASYRYFDNWILSAGIGFSYNIRNRFHQKEIIVQPTDRGVFPNGLRVRNEYAGGINGIRILLPFISFYISKEFSLHRRGALYLVPEFNYHLHFMDQVRSLTWKSQQFRVGFALKYRQPIPPPPPPPPPIDPPYPVFPMPLAPPKISLSLNYKCFDSSGIERKNVALKIEDFVSLNMKPLLNYIFFEHNSDVIPSRYVQLTPKETERFSLSQLAEKDLLQTYYNILNIVGKKLKLDPVSTIRLVGTNSNKAEEKNNLDLSRRRALAIKKYLTDIWGIEPDRIEVDARNLPKEPSNPNESQSDEENRRVEIIPSDLRIIEPILTVDTLRRTDRVKIIFYPKQDSGIGIKEWKINVLQKIDTLRIFRGFGPPPPEIVWEIDDKAFDKVVDAGFINFEFLAIDSINQFGRAITKPLNVQRVTVDKKRFEGITDREFEYYSLILFDFGKTKLETQHKSVLDFINRRITPHSQITIEGFTDNIGDEKVNKKISEKRAIEVAKWLKLNNARTVGVGEENLLFDNSLPEGRFYCRTVKITIETPIINQSK